MNSEGSEIGRFWPKRLRYSPWFWTWRTWVSIAIRSKDPESPPLWLQMDFQLFSRMLVTISGEFRRVRNRPILTKKPGLGFWKWRIWVMLGFVPNSLNFLLYTCKWISNCFRECWWRFLMNSEGSEIGRFWPKSMGYSPWFWKWRIWVSVGIRSKLPEFRPIWLQIDFQLLSRMLVTISGEFRRVRNSPILTKKPGL